MVSIYSHNNLGGLELISGVYQTNGSLSGHALICGENQNVDMSGWTWHNQWPPLHRQLAWVHLA